MIKHLGDLAYLKLLGVYNKIWEVGKFAVGWKEAVIIPIRKPGMDPSNPMNYRPIALTFIASPEWVQEGQRNHESSYVFGSRS